MSNYTELINNLESNIKQNASQLITGSVLQNVLRAFIGTLGTGSSFMGLLSESNKPTATVDGKQFYLGYTSGIDTLVNLTAVGLDTITISKGTLWIVHNLGGSWAAVDLASGLSDLIPTSVLDLSGGEDLETKHQFKKMEGSVTIDELEYNTIYEISECTSLMIGGYHYNESKAELTFPPTMIIIHSSADFTITLPATAKTLNGDALNVATDDECIVTVNGNYWKIDKYE